MVCCDNVSCVFVRTHFWWPGIGKSQKWALCWSAGQFVDRQALRDHDPCFFNHSPGFCRQDSRNHQTVHQATLIAMSTQSNLILVVFIWTKDAEQNPHTEREFNLVRNRLVLILTFLSLLTVSTLICIIYGSIFNTLFLAFQIKHVGLFHLKWQ